MSFEIAARVTARNAAFIPGASPPEVRTPIVCGLYSIVFNMFFNVFH